MEVLHRTSKWGEVRRLACPLRRFPFAAPPNCGGSPAKRARGNAFPRPQGGCMVFQRAKPGCMVFAAKGGIKNGARKGAHLASAAVLYNSRGRSPQPVREASAGPGQNPWRLGPSGPAAPSTLTPVRACQPSGILASTALRWSRSRPPRSRSRPRRRAPEPSSPPGHSPQRWEKISSAPVSSSTSRSQCLFSASFLILSASFGTITLSV